MQVVLLLVALVATEAYKANWEQALKDTVKSCVEADCAKIAPANNGKVVHLSGDSTATEVLRDEDFGVAEKAVAIKRKTLKYQWKETSSEGSSTTYDYECD